MTDMYGKLGTLYLDEKEYSKAALNIYRGCFGAKGKNINNPVVFLEMHFYLAESFHHLGDCTNNNYHYCQAKKITSDNKRIDQFRL